VERRLAAPSAWRALGPSAQT